MINMTREQMKEDVKSLIELAEVFERSMISRPCHGADMLRRVAARLSFPLAGDESVVLLDLRDDVLNSRHEFEEGQFNNDQSNTILRAIDRRLDHLSAEAEQAAPPDATSTVTPGHTEQNDIFILTLDGKPIFKGNAAQFAEFQSRQNSKT